MSVGVVAEHVWMEKWIISNWWTHVMWLSDRIEINPAACHRCVNDSGCWMKTIPWSRSTISDLRKREIIRSTFEIQMLYRFRQRVFTCCGRIPIQCVLKIKWFRLTMDFFLSFFGIRREQFFFGWEENWTNDNFRNHSIDNFSNLTFKDGVTFNHTLDVVRFGCAFNANVRISEVFY